MKQSMCHRKIPESGRRAALSAHRSGRLTIFWASARLRRLICGGQIRRSRRRGHYHVAGQSKPRQNANGQISVINFPPAMTVARRARIGMVVVMPAFAIGDEADDDVVAAVFVGLVVPVTPQMRHRINSPRNMPYEDGA